MEEGLKAFISVIESDLQRKLKDSEVQLVETSYINGFRDGSMESLAWTKEVLGNMLQ